MELPATAGGTVGLILGVLSILVILSGGTAWIMNRQIDDRIRVTLKDYLGPINANLEALRLQMVAQDGDLAPRVRRIEMKMDNGLVSRLERIEVTVDRLLEHQNRWNGDERRQHG